MNASPPTGRRPRAAPLLLVLCLVSVVVRGRADPPRPVIGAAVEISAPNFVNNLQDRRRECERAAAEVLAATAAEYFSYLAWQPASLEETNALPSAVLVAEMRGTDRGFGFEITLGYSRMLGTNRSRIAGLPQRILFSASDIAQPTQDPEALKNLLGQTLRSHLDEEPFRRALQREFLAGVPLTTNLLCRTNVQRFFLPIPWDRLLPGEGSTLLAVFKARPSPADASDVRPVTIRLRPEEAWDDGIGCLVREFHYPPVDLPEPASWHEMMAVCLDHALPGTLFVFMKDYNKDWNFGTRHALALSP